MGVMTLPPSRLAGLFTGLLATTALGAPGHTEVALVAGTLPVGVGLQVSHRRPGGWMGEAGLGTALFIHSGHVAAGYGWALVERPGFRLEVPLLATAGAFLADGDDGRPLAGALTGLQLLWPGAHVALGLRLGAVQVWSGGEDQSGVNPVAELGLGLTF